MSCLEAALEYIEHGLSIIPLQPKGKKPLIAWEEFQHRIATAEEVEGWFTKTPDANIGLVTGGISGVVVIDSDSSKAVKWMKESIPRAVLYQKTGKGWHALYKPNGKPIQNSASLIYDKVDVRGDGGYIVIAPSIHPNGGGYELVSPTGLSWGDLTCFPYELFKTKESETKKPISLDPVEKGSRDDTLARIAGTYLGKGMSPAEVLMMMRGTNLDYNPPLPDADLKRIVTSIYKKEESKGKQRKAEESNGKPIEAEESERKAWPELGKHGGASINQLVIEFVEENDGEFSTYEIDREYSFITRSEKNARSVALNKLSKDCKIKKVKGKSGRWKIVKGGLKKISLDATVQEPLNMPLPLGLGELANLYPGNIVLVSGASNAGKTSFLLSSLYTLLKETKEKRTKKEKKERTTTAKTLLEKITTNGIRYLTSEMGESELSDSCSRYPNGYNVFSEGCEFVERYNDFADVIIPNGINFIDYLQIYEDFFELGKLVNEIHETLDGGICFIACQKSPDSNYAKGGPASLEKPRLAINLDANDGYGYICKIAKLKHSTDRKQNHNGKEADYIVTDDGVQRCSAWRFVKPKDRKSINLAYEVNGMEPIPDKDYAFLIRVIGGESKGILQKQVTMWQKEHLAINVAEELRRIEADSSRKPFLDPKKYFFQIAGILGGTKVQR